MPNLKLFVMVGIVVMMPTITMLTMLKADAIYRVSTDLNDEPFASTICCSNGLLEGICTRVTSTTFTSK